MGDNASATTEEGEGEGERTDTLQWGMDPLFFAPVRLLVMHLALLTPVPDLPGAPSPWSPLSSYSRSLVQGRRAAADRLT